MLDRSGCDMAVLDEPLVMPDEMAAIDAAAIGSGIPGYQLMCAAGAVIASRLLAVFPQARRAVILAGPGNNGGDGYVAARALIDSGMPVAVHCLGDPQELRGDAARAFRDCPVRPQSVEGYRPADGDVVVDALFGAGLARPLDGDAAAIVARIAASGTPVLAVDLPSGVSGKTGAVLGAALQAAETVTFFARKPGHLLMPGRDLCGRLTVADIGIPARAAAGIVGPATLRENGAAVWAGALPKAGAAGHKYDRGHLVVLCGPATMTGAARLAAAAALAAGAGLVTVGAPTKALSTVATHVTAVMVRGLDSDGELRAWLNGSRLSAFVLGPGFGDHEKARTFALALADRPVVLDADGITAFAAGRDALFQAFANAPVRLVLTPHPGEFRRLFPDIAASGADKPAMARRAAAMANAVVILKGRDTVIAAPDGRADRKSVV